MSQSQQLENINEQLAKRYAKLSSSGMLPAPSQDNVTIIVAMTDRRWTKQCLKLLLAHSGPSVHIVVAPGTYDVSSDCDLRIEDKRVSCMPYIPGVDTVNKALSEVSTPLAALLDDNILVTPEWLTRLMWPFYDDDNVMIAAPMSPTEAPHGRLSVSFQSLRQLNDYAGERHRNLNGIWSPVPVLTGSCVMFRRTLLDRIGGRDDRLRGKSSRIADWCLRARQAGGRLALCEDVYVHAVHSLHDNVRFAEEWAPFCAKWQLTELDRHLQALGKIEAASFAPQPIISLQDRHFTPPLISVIVWLRRRMDWAGWSRLKEAQTYPAIQWILLIPACEAMDGFAWPEITAAGDIDAIIISQTKSAGWISALEAAGKLAKGECSVYCSAETLYSPHHIARMADSLFIASADIAVAVSPKEPESGDEVHLNLLERSSRSVTVPLDRLARRKGVEIGRFLDDSAPPTVQLSDPLFTVVCCTDEAVAGVGAELEGEEAGL